MKNLTILLFCLTSLRVFGQEAKTEFDGHTWEAPYYLSTPKNWTIERFLIPIGFAPQIPYNGIEDIRFAPGWGNVKSEEYWTYAFLWYLDDSPKTDANTIAKNLKNYYTGLIEANTNGEKPTPEKVTTVTTSFKETTTANDDLETYTGFIKMEDYMQHKPMILYCIVHLKVCPENNKTILFYELSPKPFTHKNWSGLNQLWLDFTCKK